MDVDVILKTFSSIWFWLYPPGVLTTFWFWLGVVCGVFIRRWCYKGAYKIVLMLIVTYYVPLILWQFLQIGLIWYLVCCILLIYINHKMKQQPIVYYVTENSIPQYQLDGDSPCPICFTVIDYRNTYQSDGAIMSRGKASYMEPCATSCHHVMHYGCLQDWLSRSPFCPVCRQTPRLKDCRVLRIRNDAVVSWGAGNVTDGRTVSTMSSNSSNSIMPMMISSNQGATCEDTPHVCLHLNSSAKPQYQLDKDSSCPICLSLMYYQNTHQSDGAMMSRDAPSDNEPCATTCDHVMHYKCLQDWLNIKRSCPVCRQPQRLNGCRVLRIRNDEVVSWIFGNVNTTDLITESESE